MTKKPTKPTKPAVKKSANTPAVKQAPLPRVEFKFGGVPVFAENDGNSPLTLMIIESSTREMSVEELLSWVQRYQVKLVAFERSNSRKSVELSNGSALSDKFMALRKKAKLSY